MFKVGDKVIDTDTPQGVETVKTVSDFAGREFIETEEWPDQAFPASIFEMVKQPFPRDGARVRDKCYGETGRIRPLGFNRGWYIDLYEGTIEVPESYLLAHFEEDQVFPYVGALVRCRCCSDDSEPGTITELDGEGLFKADFPDGQHLSTHWYGLDTFEEV